MNSDTSEKGLESLIVAAMTGDRPLPPSSNALSEPAHAYAGTGYLQVDPNDYDRDHR